MKFKCSGIVSKWVIPVLFLLLLSACGTTIKHIPSPTLSKVQIQKPMKIVVADIGDLRKNESPDRIGQGVSYWLPVSYYARDAEGGILPVSYYIADSLSQDLRELGYESDIANNETERQSLSVENALAVAREQDADYLVTVKLKDGKTNFWGFIAIPFFEPVWTRIEYDAQLIDLKSDQEGILIPTKHRDTEWYFGKITVFDALFDAGLWGRHWHKNAWGKTVVSDALAETAIQISGKIQPSDEKLTLNVTP